ncbi:penicillin-binding protein 2 [Paludibacterium sp. THUN1379]|uniref:penicillin-binding protein 2 n=1 Tax=Paludibacterium sp. THUN1379 TaxID=3112107 RepID=UPI0030859C2B|nr:penicillin-binding protein 2 [Paludibacterium sp. THUN1379]
MKYDHDEDRRFRLRLLIAGSLVLLGFLLLLGRLACLQLVRYQHFATRADSNRIALLPVEPARGRILDRHGAVLAHNLASHTLHIKPAEAGDIDALLVELRRWIRLSAREERQFRQRLQQERAADSVVIKEKLSDEEAARLAANAWQLPAIDIRASFFRDYPYGALTSHVLGYVGRISPDDRKRLTEAEDEARYRGAQSMGKIGLEKVYEDRLRGQIGSQQVETDSRGRFVRSLRQTPAEPGRDLHLTLDIRLQQRAEQLFGERRGALVAIDPQNGEVLAMLSKPGFDPALFVDGIDQDNWQALNEDWQRPLFNRALRGTYPPGSTFKPFMAMAALETGAIAMDDIRPAPGYFTLPGSSHQFRDSRKQGNGMVNLQRAIAVSSDTFFYKLAWEMGIERIHPVVGSFGLGSQTGIDLDGEASGTLPSKAWKARRFARAQPAAQRWLPADVVSIGIGQGFNAYSPLQMAHATAILASDGLIHPPHLVRAITPGGKPADKDTTLPRADATRLPYAAEHFAYVKQGMQGAMAYGTSARLGRDLAYSMAGKTGTAQVVQIRQGEKYNAAALPEQHRDHSWFIAFAPVEKPRIAVAIIVENAGFGAASAAPIARALFDSYLLQSSNNNDIQLPSARQTPINNEFSAKNKG